ncbi:MAG TPA: hypothetical protein VGL56_00460 [Fimbriimonadaceae bacterium]
MPLLSAGAGIVLSFTIFRHANMAIRILFPAIALFAGSLVKLLIEYSNTSDGRRKVLQLLSEVQVSHVNPKYVVLEGTFTGRLEAGFFWAKDFILQDETGFIAAIYRQPFLLWEGLFGWLTAPTMLGRPVRVHGWYRRFNSPFLEIDRIEMLDTHEVKKAYHYPYLLGIYAVLMVLMIVCLVVFGRG